MKAGKISYAGVGAAGGGVIGFLGVMVGWFSYSHPLGNGTATVSLSGTADWTGTVAMAAAFGAFAFGGAFVLLQDAKLRRISGVLMAVCSAFLLVMSLLGNSRISDAVGAPASVFTTAAGKGLMISFAGGVVAMVGSFLASREILAAGRVGASETSSTPAGAVEA
ncbi:MAG: hypothetical protein ACXWYT_01230 [Actinomycetota bacterium]